MNPLVTGVSPVKSGFCRFQAKRLFWGALCLALLSVTLVCGCGINLTNTTGIDNLPAFQGKILSRDLLTRDASQAKKFYASLFGWQYRCEDRFSVIIHQGREIGVIAEVPTSETAVAASRWIPSLSVENLKHAMAFTKDSGGKVNEGPVTMGKRGSGALVRDAGGAQFVLLQSSMDVSDDQILQKNGWLWDELWTDSPEDSLDFYSNLAGFSASEAKDGYWILSSNGKWQAGVRKVFDERFVQRWVPVVWVADPQATAQNAQDLGGRVLIDTSGSEEDRPAALISDPAGALFIVQAWSDTTAKGGE